MVPPLQPSTQVSHPANPEPPFHRMELPIQITLQILHLAIFHFEIDDVILTEICISIATDIHRLIAVILPERAIIQSPGAVVTGDRSDVVFLHGCQSVLKSHPCTQFQLTAGKPKICAARVQHVIDKAHVMLQHNHLARWRELQHGGILAQEVIHLPAQLMLEHSVWHHPVDIPVYIVVNNKKARFLQPSYIDIGVVQVFILSNGQEESPVILKGDLAATPST